MDVQKNNEIYRKKREPQMVGERKKRTRVKEYYDTADIVNSVLEKCGWGEESDANSRSIRRIVELMNRTTGNGKFKTKDRDVFDKVVGITERIYNNTNLKKLISREELKKNLTVEEYDILINAFVDEINKDKSLEEKEEILKIVESMKGNDLIKKAEELRNYFNQELTKSMERLLDIEFLDERMRCFNSYKESIYSSISKLRSEIEKMEKIQNAIISVSNKEPNLLDKKDLMKGVISEELAVKLLVEMDLKSAIKDFEEYIRE